jgi:hypothetical protein
MKNFIRKLFGIDKLLAEKEHAQAETIKAKHEEELAKLTPKERATAKGEPWVDVLEIRVNKDNPRNGFFELDWNEFFVNDLKKNGYGFDGDPEEEIVDRWFRELAINMSAEAGNAEPTKISAGFIDVNRIAKNHSEIS